MSSSLSSSPFVSALPVTHVFSEYDADGDVIMTDAVTGLPITYGSKRNRSDSVDSGESRASKRSRTPSDDGSGSGRLSPIKIPRAPVGIPTTVCPGAPKKAAPPAPPVAVPVAAEADGSAVQNLAEAMAEAVLAGEPRDPAPAAAAPAVVAVDVAVDVAPPGGEPVLVPVPVEPQGWCLAVNCADLALRLDMRHPRVVLNFLRFVDTYNELAPEGEEIHVPYMDSDTVSMILSHESITDPAAEFADDVAELRQRVYSHSCQCPDCAPDNWSDSHEDEDDDRDSRYSRDSRY